MAGRFCWRDIINVARCEQGKSVPLRVFLDVFGLADLSTHYEGIQFEARWFGVLENIVECCGVRTEIISASALVGSYLIM